MNDIAKMARVSLGTVSNVLNNSAVVRDSLRKRVLDAVKATGYQPSQLARGLRRVKTNVIGMIIPDITNPFFPAVVRGAEDVAFSVQIQNNQWERRDITSRFTPHIEALLQHGVPEEYAAILAPLSVGNRRMPDPWRAPAHSDRSTPWKLACSSAGPAWVLVRRC